MLKKWKIRIFLMDKCIIATKKELFGGWNYLTVFIVEVFSEKLKLFRGWYYLFEAWIYFFSGWNNLNPGRQDAERQAAGLFGGENDRECIWWRELLANCLLVAIITAWSVILLVADFTCPEICSSCPADLMTQLMIWWQKQLSLPSLRGSKYLFRGE